MQIVSLGAKYAPLKDLAPDRMVDLNPKVILRKYDGELRDTSTSRTELKSDSDSQKRLCNEKVSNKESDDDCKSPTFYSTSDDYDSDIDYTLITDNKQKCRNDNEKLFKHMSK